MIESPVQNHPLDEAKDCSPIYRLVEKQALATPHNVALVYGNRRLTYAELNGRANKLARYLRATYGCCASVAVSLERSPEQIIALLAVLKAGAACVPVDVEYPSDRISFMLATSKASVLITHSQLADRFSSTPIPILNLDKDVGRIESQNSADLNEPQSAASPCYIVFTSGSTGFPKGVVMPHAALTNLIEWHRYSEDAPGKWLNGCNQPTVTLQFAAVGFDVSFQEIFSTLTSGGTLVLVPDTVRADPEALIDHILKFEIERLFIPVVTLIQIAESVLAGAKVPSTLRDIITAGEALRITPDVAALFAKMPDCTLHNHYGPSETHVVTTFKLCGAPDCWPILPPIGRAIWNTELFVLDDIQVPVPFGDSGELYLAGICLADRYANSQELTNERFVTIPHPDKSGVTVRVYRTGDLVKQMPDGNLAFIGRSDTQVKIRGYRIEPGEIEDVVGRDPAVRSCAVVVRSFDDYDKQLVAYVVPSGTDKFSANTVRGNLRKTLPDYMIPAAFIAIDHLPLTASGKIDRKTLSERSATEIEPPTSQSSKPRNLRETVAAIWRNNLHAGSVEYDDNFFEVGGSSLLAVRMHRELKDALSLEFAVTALFEFPTINRLSRYLETFAQKTEVTVARADENTDNVRLNHFNRLRELRNR